MGLVIRNEQQLKSLIGLSQDEFDYLFFCFSDAYLNRQQYIYEKWLDPGTRIRKIREIYKGKLPTGSYKLIFCA
jgi:hypothetical protein